MTTAKPVTGRENKLTKKKRRPTELCHIVETIVNKRCGVRRGGHSSQDHPQIPRTRQYISRRRNCGNVGISRFLRDFKGAVGRVGSPVLAFRAFHRSAISIVLLCSLPRYAGRT